jgi:hypothetical protein
MKSLYIKLITAILMLSSVVIVAQVPLSDKRTVWQHVFGKQKQKAEAAPPKKDPILAEALGELRKISEAFSADSLTLSGSIKLYDNLDEKGIHESQNFIWQKAGSNQYFKIDSIEKILLQNRFLFIDHREKEIISSESKLDSVLKSMQLISPEKVLDLLGKDGTTARFASEDHLKVLYIEPGSRDEANEYVFYYDPNTYVLRKFSVSYTSAPFEDEIIVDNQVASDTKQVAGEEKMDDDDAVEVNLTEYIVEYNFQRLDKNCRFDFSNNEVFRKENGELAFKGKISSYNLVEF